MCNPLKIKSIIIIYYPCSKIKGADQLRGYNCDTDLRLCFRIYGLFVFSRGGSNIWKEFLQNLEIFGFKHLITIIIF